MGSHSTAQPFGNYYSQTDMEKSQSDLEEVRQRLKEKQREMNDMIRSMAERKTPEPLEPSPQKGKRQIYNRKMKKKKSNYEYFIRRAKETHHADCKTIEQGGRFYETPSIVRKRDKSAKISQQRKEKYI